MSIPVPPVPTFLPSEHTLTDVKGLRAAGVRAGIKASGNPDVALLVADAPMACAGVFTQNHFAAAPVLLSKAHLQKSGDSSLSNSRARLSGEPRSTPASVE